MQAFKLGHDSALTALGMSDQARDLAKDFRVAIISNLFANVGRMPMLIASLLQHGHDDSVSRILQGDDEETQMTNLVCTILI